VGIAMNARGNWDQSTAFFELTRLTYRADADADADADGLVLGRLLPSTRFSGGLVRVG
jgi:hypothetical protein